MSTKISSIAEIKNQKELLNLAGLYEEARREYNDFNDAFCEIFQPNSVTWSVIRQLLEFYHEQKRLYEKLKEKYSSDEILMALEEVGKDCGEEASEL